jgi:hypothetical protein
MELLNFYENNNCGERRVANPDTGKIQKREVSIDRVCICGVYDIKIFLDSIKLYF